MDIQAAGINNYYTYQPTFERGSDLLPASSEPGAQNADVSESLSLPDSQKQVDPASRIQEGDSSQNEGQSSVPDTESELTLDEKLLVEQLEKLDLDVRAHEMAHIAAGGEYITSGATFSYKQGPDGINYAVGGEVSIDTSSESGDPEATLQKMRRVRAAALAPADPSSQDLKVASSAASQATKATAQITQLKADEQAELKDATISDYTKQQISDAYAKADGVSSPNSPDQDTQNSFHIAV